jgi:hypothetical protein
MSKASSCSGNRKFRSFFRALTRSPVSPGISRPTKDLDVFCKPSDAPEDPLFFKSRGYRIEMEDERWIGKVWSGDNFFDVIFNISSASIPITDEWFQRCL